MSKQTEKNTETKELSTKELDTVVGGGANPGKKPTLPPAPTF